MSPKKSTKEQPSGKNGAEHEVSPDGLHLLEARHKAIGKLVEDLANFEVNDDKIKALKKLCTSWLELADAQDEILFDKLAESGVEEISVDEARIEHDLARVLIDDLVSRRAQDPLLVAEVNVLLRTLPRLIALAEEKSKGLFAKARKGGIDVEALEEALKDRLPEGEGRAEETKPQAVPRYLRGVGALSKAKEREHMRGMERERDERGRFVEEDNRRGGQRDYESRRSSGGRSRYDDDDDNRGWHGDSRGHSEAARRGWETRRSGRDYDDDDRRGGYRGRGTNDDDDRRRSRSRDYDDDDRRGGYRSRGSDDDDRRRGGWFGDPEGHSEASRKGWDNPDHAPSGWFGDREGHRQAAMRGWDNPDHGRSGWFGDPEGHSEASRRGWEGRRRDDDDDYDRRRSSRRRYD